MKLFAATLVAVLGAAVASSHRYPSAKSGHGEKGYPSMPASGGYHQGYRQNFNNLVTLRPKHLIAIMDCASTDDRRCRGFTQCESLAANTPVTDAVKRCQQIQIPHRTTKCYYREPEFQEHGSEQELFECVSANTAELTPEQKRRLVALEDCVQDMLKNECRGPKSYYPSHAGQRKLSKSHYKDLHH